jgi:hypothetical protein
MARKQICSSSTEGMASLPLIREGVSVWVRAPGDGAGVTGGRASIARIPWQGMLALIARRFIAPRSVPATGCWEIRTVIGISCGRGRDLRRSRARWCGRRGTPVPRASATAEPFLARLGRVQRASGEITPRLIVLQRADSMEYSLSPTRSKRMVSVPGRYYRSTCEPMTAKNSSDGK